MIDDFSVWHHTDIQEVSENIGEDTEFHGYEFGMVQYDKNEYILKQTEQNQQMNAILNTMLGVNE